MTPPFANQHGAILVTDELIESICSFTVASEQKQAIHELISDIESPYELINLAVARSQPELDDCCPDLASTVIDYIIANADQWDEDEVACFLLEILFEYRWTLGSVRNLIRLNNSNMIKLPYAGAYIWEQFWNGTYPDVLHELFVHYGWLDYVAKEIDALAQDSAENVQESLHYKATAEMVRRGAINGVPEDITRDYVTGNLYLHVREYMQAIEPLVRFRTNYPLVFPVQLCLDIATCQREAGWNTFALDYVEEALRLDPTSAKAERLRLDILTPQTDLAQQLESQYCQPHWTPDCCTVIVATEVIFRFHGRISRDYGAIINGYGRAVEILLRQAVLPQLRELIRVHGSLDKKGHRYLKCGAHNDDRLRFDDPDQDYTLGKWSRVFAADENFLGIEDQECLHYYTTRYNNSNMGYYEWAKLIYQFGNDINRMKSLRNPSSHDTVGDWDNVITARDISFEILTKMPVSLGNLYKPIGSADIV